MGDRAPAGLRDDVATLRSVVGELAALDGSDPASVDRALGIVLRPEVLAASEAIDTYAKQRCGVDLGMTSGDAESPGSSGMDAAATGSGDIDLEDVDAVRTANGSASWSDKLTSTTILNDTDVTLAADDASALTADEALAACRAVRAALVAINSRVVVTIRSGGTAVAVAPADGECAPA